MTITTAGIFATYPQPGLTVFGALIDELVGTTLLIVIILALTDKYNAEYTHGNLTILIGIAITILGTAFGYNSGKQF